MPHTDRAGSRGGLGSQGRNTQLCLRYSPASCTSGCALLPASPDSPTFTCFVPASVIPGYSSSCPVFPISSLTFFFPTPPDCPQNPSRPFQETIRPPVNVPRSSQAFAQEQLSPPLCSLQQPHDFHSNILQILPAPPNCLQCSQVLNTFP